MKLGECGRIGIGLILSRKKASFEADVREKYKVLTVKSFEDDGTINMDNLDTLQSMEELDDHYLTQLNDVVVRLTHPYTAILIDKSLEGLVISSLFAVIRLRTDLLMPEYLAVTLNSISIKNKINRMQLGTSMPILKKSFLVDLHIPETPLNLQEKIAAYSRLHRKQMELLRRLAEEKETFYQASLSELLNKATIREELDSLLDQYKIRFGDVFPSMQVAIHGEGQFIEKVKLCLTQDKPASEVFNIPDDPDILF